VSVKRRKTTRRRPREGEEANGDTARPKAYRSGAAEQEGGQRRGAAVALAVCVDRRDVGSARVHVAVGVARLGLSEDLEAGRLQQRIGHGARQSSIAHQERDWPNSTLDGAKPRANPFIRTESTTQNRAFVMDQF
jgi:hypothetical protein